MSRVRDERPCRCGRPARHNVAGQRLRCRCEDFCKHGTFIGDPYGPDYLCGWCEDGVSDADFEAWTTEQRRTERVREICRKRWEKVAPTLRAGDLEPDSARGERLIRCALIAAGRAPRRADRCGGPGTSEPLTSEEAAVYRTATVTLVIEYPVEVAHPHLWSWGELTGALRLDREPGDDEGTIRLREPRTTPAPA